MFKQQPNIVWGGRGGGALVEKTEVSFCGQCGGCLSKLKVMGGALCLSEKGGGAKGGAAIEIWPPAAPGPRRGRLSAYEGRRPPGRQRQTGTVAPFPIRPFLFDSRQ